jgi:hypothetical protein
VFTVWKRNEEMNGDIRELTGKIKVKGVPFKSEGEINQIWMMNTHTEYFKVYIGRRSR